MKKTFLFTCMLIVNSIAFSQESKFGITAQLNTPSEDEVADGWFNPNYESIDNYNVKRSSYSVGALLQYKLSEDTRLRVRLGYTHIEMMKYRIAIDSEFEYDRTYTAAQNKFHLAPGITWPVKFKKVEFFGGFELPFNYHGAFQSDLSSTVTNISTGNLESEISGNRTLSDGYSVGLGALLGFNYVPAKWFSIGAEFSPSMLYANLGGETSASNMLIGWSISDDENKGFGFYEQRFSLNVGFWF